MIERWADVVARRSLAVLLVSVALLAGAGFYGASVFDSVARGGFDTPGSEAYAQAEAEREAFGNRAADVVIIYSDDELSASDPEFREALLGAVEGYPEDAIAGVSTPYDVPEGAPAGTVAPDLVSADGRSARVVVSLAGASQDDRLEAYDALEPALGDAGPLTSDVAGVSSVYSDVNDITGEDLRRAEELSLPIVAVLALLIFGSVVAASMPVVVGAVAVVGALAMVQLFTEFTDVSVFAINVITLLGMGLAIDYALFIVSRFREELAELPADDPDAASTAIRRTLATAGRTVLFSGLTVAAAMATLMVFPQNFLRSMAYGGVAAVLIAMLAALTLLPAVLRLLGRRIDGGRLPWRRGRPVVPSSDRGAWARLATGVMRRPVLIAVGVTVGLGALAIPFFGASFASVDYRTLPEEAPSRVAAERINDDFGEVSEARLLLSGADAADRSAYADEVGAIDGVTQVQTLAENGDEALFRATWTGNTQTDASQDLLREIRDVEPASGEVLVGGMTAETIDLVGSITDRVPLMVGIIVVVMALLLFVAFGSVVLPLKAIVMNVLSIGAAFGVVTWIFADGHLSGLLGFTELGYLEVTDMILIFAVLFGLSMDYEVFLLSRVREQWDASGDNDLAVRTGVQKTGRIITSAALLLGVVIGAFGTSGIVFMKMIGVGMLVALFLDATVVRALLVPATMKLLGRWNWWAPGPLARWWGRHGFREEPAAAGPGAVAPPQPHGPKHRAEPRQPV